MVFHKNVCWIIKPKVVVMSPKTSHIEMYHSAKSYSLSCRDLDDGPAAILPPLPDQIKSKLSYYQSGANEPVVMSAHEAFEFLINSTGHDAAHYSALLTKMQKFEVTYPNQFLREDNDEYSTGSLFAPKGAAADMLLQTAARISHNLLESESGKSKEERLFNSDALPVYIESYMQSVLSGPFAAVVGLDEYKPVLSLNDMSYTGIQLFRAFSGIYCDATPVFNLSRTDMMAFAAEHEIGHRETAKLLEDGISNQFIPGIEMDINANAMATQNLSECAADAYAVLSYMRRTGSDEFPRQFATMRALSLFTNQYKHFETGFTLAFGGSRRRAEVEHYTAPVIDATIERARALQLDDTLSRLSDMDIAQMAVNIAREMRPAAETLNQLSTFATTMIFNALRYYQNSWIPESKESISPVVVKATLDHMREKGGYKPRGGSAIEFFRRATESNNDCANLFSSNNIVISPELIEIFDRYDQALSHLQETGLSIYDMDTQVKLYDDLLNTLAQPANQTPNLTLAREFNDATASHGKCRALNGHYFQLIGVRMLFKDDGDKMSNIAYDIDTGYMQSMKKRGAPFEAALMRSLYPQKQPPAFQNFQP